MPPKEWLQRKLGEVTDVVGGGTPPKENARYWGGPIPWVTPTDVTGLRARELSATSNYITEEALSSSAAKLLPVGTVLMTSRATIGACAIAARAVATNQGFQNLVPRAGVTSNYLFYLVQNLRPKLVQLAAGSTFLEISGQSVRSIEVLLPPLREQVKIAAILSAIDDTIERTVVVTERLRDLRYSLLCQLMVGGLGRHSSLKATQIGQIPATWEVRTLSELCLKIVDGVHKKPTYVTTGIPFVTVKNLTAGPGISFANLKFVTRADHEQFKRRADPQLGDVLLSKDGTLGVPRVVETSRDFSIFVSIALLKPDRRQLDSFFLRYALEAPAVSRQFAFVKSGSALKHIHLVDLRRTACPVPPLDEQVAISAVLRNIDQRIAAEENYKGELSTVKSIFLYSLICGEIRVPLAVTAA